MMESVAPAAMTARVGWKARQVAGPMRWPLNPSWYLIHLSTYLGQGTRARAHTTRGGL